VPRYLPLLADDLEAECRNLLSFARRLEVNHAALRAPNSCLTLTGLELSYELIFLKIFLLWEDFQEQVFLRLLTGYASNGGQEVFLPGQARSSSLGAAKVRLLGAHDYKLWHNPDTVIKRSDLYFDPGTSFFRSVIAANRASLADFAAVRHRIAHAQEHAATQFDDATMNLAGRRYPAARPGRFLRDCEPAAPQRRWLEVIATEISDVAHQLC
jgi:hypothetical protein